MHQIPLRQGAAARNQLGALLFGLHPLGHYVDPQGAGHTDDRGGDRLVVGVIGDPIDEAAIDLETVDGVALEIGQ